MTPYRFHILRYFIFVALLCVISACIKDDIPYPRIQANFRSIQAVGESAPASIDSTDMVVTLHFPENANIYSVKIEGYSLTPGAHVVDGALDGSLDLSAPYSVTLALYQDYIWTICADRPVSRAFAVSSQIGQSVIDEASHTVMAYVNKKVDLAEVYVRECRLGPSSASLSPDIVGRYVDFSSPVTVTVDDYGHPAHWTISVAHAETPVTTLSVDAWTCVAWTYGEAEASRHNTVQYRIQGDTQWITVPDSWVSSSGGTFVARIIGLQPLTTYETRAVSDSDFGETLVFTTGSEAQMPNSDFDQWWLDGKVWDPWAEGTAPYWDTGNKGAATLGQSNSVPTDDTVDGKGRAAMLQTKFIGIGMLGKLGAGNIFVGSYVRTEGTNGVLSFGREFSERPTRLTGYFKYHSAPISSATSGFESLKGRPDTCSIWIALIDTDAPLEIRTNPANRCLFDPDADYVVAYGAMQTGDDVDAYLPFDIPLVYRSTSRVPKYILVTASASKYGDYFTGGNGSVLYVDDFKLLYDY